MRKQTGQLPSIYKNSEISKKRSFHLCRVQKPYGRFLCRLAKIWIFAIIKSESVSYLLDSRTEQRSQNTGIYF